MTATDDLLLDLRAQLRQLQAPEGYLNAGLPNYDHLFGRDSCIAALQTLDETPSVARATLRVLHQFQGNRRVLFREEFRGKILHEHFVGGARKMWHDFWHDTDKLRKLEIFLLWRFPYYGSVDAGAWYLILLHHYYHKTGDAALVNELWPAVEGIDHWLRHHAAHTHTGLVGFRRHYVFGLRNQSWKDNLFVKIAPPTAMVEVQGYYHYAYTLIAELARAVRRDEVAADRYLQRAAGLRAAWQTNFAADLGAVPIAVNGRGRPVPIVSSNPGHLLFTGILTATEAKDVVARLFQADLWTPYGIRTESAASPTFNYRSYHEGSVWPFDNWVIYQGLRRYGFTAEATRVRDALLAAQAAIGHSPELYAVTRAGQLEALPDACTTQAWTAGALFHMLTHDTAAPAGLLYQ